MKNNIFGLVVLTMLTFLSSLDSLAQCSAVNFETSSIGSVQGVMAYRTVLDFNGDGKIDFAGDNDNPVQQVNNVSVLQNNGAGGFTPITLTVSNSAGGVFFGGDWQDFNADGRPDMLAYFSTAPSKVIFYNNGSGGLTRGNNLEFGSTYEYVSSEDDINHDGRVDFITTGPPNAGADEPNYYLYLSNGNGTYAARVLITTEHANLFFGDFNGDGNKDIAINRSISNSNNYTLRYWMQNAGGTFTQTPETFLGLFRIEGVAEFNRDGKDDFYGTTSFSTTVSFLLSNANGAHTASDSAVGYKDGTYRLYFGDFNGDGNQDVLDSGRAYNATYGYTALFGNGAGAFRAFSNAVTLDDQEYNKVAQAVDFNNDGKTDLVRFSIDSATNRVSIDLLKTVCARAGQTKTVDFDGDGKTDMAFWNPATGKWSIKSSAAPNAAPQTIVFGSGSLGDVPAVGDYDGDGRTDIAVYRNNAGVWYILRSSDNAVSAVQFGTNGDQPVAADYDGDGRTDVAVFRPSEGNWYILRSQSGQFQAVTFGQIGDRTVQSDFDGDGRADIAVYRPSQGNWYYLRSIDNQFAAFNFGASGDKPVAADYDGDGKSDIAVFRPAEGNWYVRQSATQTMSAAHWGANGDVPLSFDSNGDGKYEFNVYRPNANVWYLSPSTATVFGAAGDVPVSLN